MASLQLLAIKAKTWRDLVSDEPFTREDIITLQVSVLSALESELTGLGSLKSRVEGSERI